jgi:hypothetical protein
MQNADQNVSTEAQRQALEEMSNELVRKLNLMIQEQEQRAREFAATHHSTLPTPAAPVLNIPAPEPVAKAPAPATVYAPASPPPPVTRREQQPSPKREQPTRCSAPSPGAKKTKPQEEEGNIGMGIVIFSLVGIIMVIRSCT